MSLPERQASALTMSRRQFIKDLTCGLSLAMMPEISTVQGVNGPMFLETRTVSADRIRFLGDKNIHSGDTSRKVILLTYDDQGTPALVSPILDGLKKYHAQATFFLNGIQFDAYADTVRRMRADGHVIGYHTCDHKLLTKMTSAEIKRDFSIFMEKVNRIIPGYDIWCARPPYGETNASVRQTLAELGLHQVIWNVTSGGENKDQTIQNVKAGMKPGALVLGHLLRRGDSQAVEPILEFGSRMGFSFESVATGLKWEDYYHPKIKPGRNGHLYQR